MSLIRTQHPLPALVNTAERRARRTSVPRRLHLLLILVNTTEVRVRDVISL